MSGKLQDKRIRVMGYSGHKANERPLYFFMDGQRLVVNKMLDQWKGQQHDYFKVLADDGRTYVLKWHRFLDIWLMDDQSARARAGGK